MEGKNTRKLCELLGAAVIQSKSPVAVGHYVIELAVGTDEEHLFTDWHDDWESLERECSAAVRTFG